MRPFIHLTPSPHPDSHPAFLLHPLVHLQGDKWHHHCYPDEHYIQTLLNVRMEACTAACGAPQLVMGPSWP